MAKDRVQKPFVFVTPHGVEWVGLADCISHAWQIALGWPDEIEIEEAEAGGCFMAPAAVRFRDKLDGHEKHINQVTGVQPRDGAV